MEVVEVTLKNPPSGATNWFLSFYPWSGSGSVQTPELGLTDKAILNIPSGWLWPLRFYAIAYHYIGDAIDFLHQAQSLYSDWLYYVEEFLQSPGSYYYNAQTGKFEVIVPEQSIFSDFGVISFSKV